MIGACPEPRRTRTLHLALMSSRDALNGCGQRDAPTSVGGRGNPLFHCGSVPPAPKLCKTPLRPKSLFRLRFSSPLRYGRHLYRPIASPRPDTPMKSSPLATRRRDRHAAPQRPYRSPGDRKHTNVLIDNAWGSSYILRGAHIPVSPSSDHLRFPMLWAHLKVPHRGLPRVSARREAAYPH